MTALEEQVVKIVRSIPPGKVMSYGQVALYAGKLNGAREAGAAMRALGHMSDFPWWRVLNSAGEISIAGNPTADAVMQQDLLKKEGVEFAVPYRLDMNRYRHQLDRKALEELALTPLMLESALHKYGDKDKTGSLGL